MTITPEHIQAVVSDYFGIARDRFIEEDRKRAASRPRQIAIFLARELTTLSFAEIGMAFRRTKKTAWDGWHNISYLANHYGDIGNAVAECRQLVLASKGD